MINQSSIVKTSDLIKEICFPGLFTPFVLYLQGNHNHKKLIFNKSIENITT